MFLDFATSTIEYGFYLPSLPTTFIDNEGFTIGMLICMANIMSIASILNPAPVAREKPNQDIIQRLEAQLAHNIQVENINFVNSNAYIMWRAYKVHEFPEAHPGHLNSNQLLRLIIIIENTPEAKILYKGDLEREVIFYRKSVIKERIRTDRFFLSVIKRSPLTN
jgi:hypothetical protein